MLETVEQAPGRETSLPVEIGRLLRARRKQRVLKQTHFGIKPVRAAGGTRQGQGPGARKLPDRGDGELTLALTRGRRCFASAQHSEGHQRQGAAGGIVQLPHSTVRVTNAKELLEGSFDPEPEVLSKARSSPPAPSATVSGRGASRGAGRRQPEVGLVLELADLVSFLNREKKGALVFVGPFLPSLLRAEEQNVMAKAHDHIRIKGSAWGEERDPSFLG